MEFYTYVLLKPNGVPFYVGKGRGRRFSVHLSRSHNPRVRNIVAKHGRDNIVVRRAGYLTEPEAFELEHLLVATIGRYPTGTLVNDSEGGRGGSAGRLMSDEERERRHQIMSDPSVRTKLSISHKGKISPRKGAVLTPETIEKLRVSHTGKTQSPEIVEKRISQLRGKPRPAHVRAILASHHESLRGKPVSDDMRAKMRAGWARRKAERI